MKKEYFNLLVLALVVTGITSLFFKDILSGIKLMSSLFFLFVLPGFALLYKKDFIERVIFGFFISLALVGILSYYIGLIFMNISLHWMIAPIITLIGITLEISRKKEL